MTIQLYHRWSCPYSARVRDFIQEHELAGQIQYIELSEVDEAEPELIKLTGRSQVPCLVVDGEPTLESSRIIQWLQAKLVDTEGASGS